MIALALSALKCSFSLYHYVTICTRIVRFKALPFTSFVPGQLFSKQLIVEGVSFSIFLYSFLSLKQMNVEEKKLEILYQRQSQKNTLKQNELESKWAISRFLQTQKEDCVVSALDFGFSDKMIGTKEGQHIRLFKNPRIICRVENKEAVIDILKVRYFNTLGQIEEVELVGDLASRFKEAYDSLKGFSSLDKLNEEERIKVFHKMSTILNKNLPPFEQSFQSVKKALACQDLEDLVPFASRLDILSDIDDPEVKKQGINKLIQAFNDGLDLFISAPELGMPLQIMIARLDTGLVVMTNPKIEASPYTVPYKESRWQHIFADTNEPILSFPFWIKVRFKTEEGEERLLEIDQQDVPFFMKSYLRLEGHFLADLLKEDEKKVLTDYFAKNNNVYLFFEKKS
ncbi:MAG: hypothetical protein ACOVOR_03065 [Rhabdochlamydiaceae bacterium]